MNLQLREISNRKENKITKILTKNALLKYTYPIFIFTWLPNLYNDIVQMLVKAANTQQ